MQILDSLERQFGKFSIPNLTYYLIAGQILAFVFLMLNPAYDYQLMLIGNQVITGELWRLVTFIFIPISMSPIFAAFSWYFYYLIGMALEKEWGSFRYLMYILIVYAGTLLIAFVFPNQPLSNIYIYTSVFLAFARLNPEFTMLILFILPIKIKWLALLAWIGIIFSLLTAPIPEKFTALASVANFLLFFGEDILTTFRLRAHHVSHEAKSQIIGTKAYHVCAVCKRNEVKDPDMKILYCNDCKPETCYCENHINNHSHKLVN